LEQTAKVLGWRFSPLFPKACEGVVLLMDKIPLTTKDDEYPIIYRVLTIPGGAGFLPSTVG